MDDDNDEWKEERIKLSDLDDGPFGDIFDDLPMSCSVEGDENFDRNSDEYGHFSNDSYFSTGLTPKRPNGVINAIEGGQKSFGSAIIRDSAVDDLLYSILLVENEEDEANTLELNIKRTRLLRKEECYRDFPLKGIKINMVDQLFKNLKEEQAEIKISNERKITGLVDDPFNLSVFKKENFMKTLIARLNGLTKAEEKLVELRQEETENKSFSFDLAATLTKAMSKDDRVLGKDVLVSGIRICEETGMVDVKMSVGKVIREDSSAAIGSALLDLADKGKKS